MRSVSIPGSSLFPSRPSRLVLAACGWAAVVAGCGDFGSSPARDAGTDVKGGSGGAAMNTGGRGGNGSGGATGQGGASAGGNTGAGGIMDAGMDVGTDAGMDMTSVCNGPDAGEGGPGDTDTDGTPDCLDGCPNDMNKVAPGLCGCGVLDNDEDNDGVPDCQDRCPGVPDVDSDSDGVLDCLDACPHDMTRTMAGACGCGVPETTPLCLVHRYSFDDSSTTIADSITIAGGISPVNGTATGTMPANGRIVLAGGLSNQIGGQFVTLPGGTISKLGNTATFEAWVTWNPVVPTTSGSWQRIFDFGNSDQTNPGVPGAGQTYLFLSPSNGSTNLLRSALPMASNGAEDLIDGTGALPANTTLPVHVAVVVNDATRMMSMYVNGVPNGPSVALRAGSMLSALKDVNNWLGRSQWAGDQLFAGALYEFRIYGAALTPGQIAASFSAGPDALPSGADGGTTDGPVTDAPADIATGADGGTDTPTSADGGTDAAPGQ